MAAKSSTPAAWPVGPEDSLSPADFARLRAYILDASGIKLPPGKATMLEGRLRRRVRATGAKSLTDYCRWLFDGENLDVEGHHLLNAVTTNKTDFFREPQHFDYLVGNVLPKMLQDGVRRIRAWSAACSTGAEPYTIAMLLDAFARDSGGPSYGVLATDLDTEVLETARRGIFPEEAIAPVPKALCDRYVLRSLRSGQTNIRIAPKLRSAVGFAQLNLMSDSYPVGEMDLIFCRNVLIYFERETQEKVVRRLVDCLAPGGYLFLGHSETITGYDLPLVAVANTVFTRSPK